MATDDQIPAHRIHYASSLVGRTGRIARHDGTESAEDFLVTRFLFDNRGGVAGLMVVPVMNPGGEPKLAPLEAFRPTDGSTPEPTPPTASAPDGQRYDPYLIGYHLAGLLRSSGLGDEAVGLFHGALIEAAKGVADVRKDLGTES